MYLIQTLICRLERVRKVLTPKSIPLHLIKVSNILPTRTQWRSCILTTYQNRLLADSDEISTSTHNSHPKEDDVFECKSNNRDNDDVKEPEGRRGISVVDDDSKQQSGKDSVSHSWEKPGSDLDVIKIEGNASSEDTMLEVVVAGESLEVSRAAAVTSLAAIIVKAHEKAGTDQETTSHQELERLMVAVAAKEAELVDRDERIAALEQKLSDMIQQSGHEDTGKVKQELNETLCELACAQAKLMEQLSADRMVHVVTAQTAERVERDVAKCKIKNFVKKLEDRVKTLEASEEEAKQLKIIVATLQEEKMQVINEKEALAKHLVVVEEEMTEIRKRNAVLDAAETDYHHAKHRPSELEVVLSEMAISHAQLETEARNHQEHRSILSSKVRNLKEEIEVLTTKVKNMEAEQSKAPIFAAKKSKKRKTMKKDKVCPQPDKYIDLDKYLLAVKSNKSRRRPKVANAVAVLVAMVAALLGIHVACGIGFPVDLGMMVGNSFCKPTDDIFAWLAGTHRLSAELQQMRKKAEEIKMQKAKLDDLLRDKEAMIKKLIENHEIDRKVTMQQILKLKRTIPGL